MTPIFQALGLGYNATQIISFLSRAFPQVGNQVKKAAKAGYSANQIVDFLGKTMQSTPYSEEDTESSIRGRQRKRREEIEKSLLKTAATAAVAYGAGRALPAVAQGIRGVFGSGGPPAAPGPAPVPTAPSPQPPIGPQPMAGAPVRPAPIPPVGPAPAQGVPPAPLSPQGSTPNLPQNPISPSGVPQQSGINAKSLDLIKALGVEDKIKNLSGRNPPDVVAGVIRGTLDPMQKEILKERMKGDPTLSVEQAVKDYLATGQAPNAPKEVSATPVRNVLERPGQKLDETVQGVPQAKMEKGSLVFDTKSGIGGEIKDIKQKEALVQDGSKIHKVKVEDLEQPPEDIVETVQRLLEIPEVDRSSVISLVTYRPASKQMFVQYHNGETYVYEDIPQERVDEIANAMGVPVTSGKNIYGAWEQGKQDSRGAALIHGIIRDPKYSKENEGTTWEKLGTAYDYWKKLRKTPKRKRK